MKRKICVFTGTRAEYGLLKPLIDKLRASRDITLQTVVSGTHLSREFGYTHREIEKDGVPVSEKVRIPLASDTPTGIAESMGAGIIGYARALRRLKPDITVILGDRFEALSMAAACLVSRVPIAHINGGESTFGLIDEAIRHSITKMSHLHFTSTDIYKRRVIQLGENPETVFNVGALGIDNIKNMKFMSKEALKRELGVSFLEHNFLVTFHPVTLEKNTARTQFGNVLKALSVFKNTGIIFTQCNADTGGRVINRMIDKYVMSHRGTSAVFPSLGQKRYLSVMKYMDAVIGNSSSGIIEAPALHVPVINIGDRQKGRISSGIVVSCGPEREDIVSAVKKIYSDGFKALVSGFKNPYGNGRAAGRIAKVLCRCPLEGILKKEFYDMNVTYNRRVSMSEKNDRN